MQDQKYTKAEFTRRTDGLAAQLGISLREVPSRMGISHASFFNYRSGANPISRKAWSKLDQTEKRAASQLEYPLSEPDRSTMVNEDSGSGYGEYLAFIRGCRVEAERLSGGEVKKTLEIFEKLISNFHRSGIPTTKSLRDMSMDELVAHHEAVATERIKAESRLGEARKDSHPQGKTPRTGERVKTG